MEHTITMTVQIIEFLREILGYNLKDFLNHMNKNNLWEIFNNTDVINGCMWAEAEDILELFRGDLTENEQHNIISRYNSRFQGN